MQQHIYYTLPQTILEQIEALHTACLEKFSGPSLLGLVLPEADVRESDTFYALYYIKGAPVSFLSCFCPDGRTAEISGFTAPEFRKQGCFSCLLKEARQEARDLFGDVDFSFQCLSSDPDTAAFCKAHGLVLSHSECMMEKQKEKPLPASSPSVCLHPSADRKTLARLHEKIFGCPYVFSVDYIVAALADEDTVSYVISADNTAVGLLHLTFYENVYLMGLGILPEYRKKGFAEVALRAALSLLSEHSSLILQVSTANTAAFGLYQKMGFRIVSRLDYFH